MPFKPGQSGNPNGRPRISGVIAELARQHGPEAIKRLAHWMSSDNPKASIAASNALLDRGYGRPMQEIEHGGIDGKPLGPVLNITMSTMPTID